MFGEKKEYTKLDGELAEVMWCDVDPLGDNDIEGYVLCHGCGNWYLNVKHYDVPFCDHCIKFGGRGDNSAGLSYSFENVSKTNINSSYGRILK